MKNILVAMLALLVTAPATAVNDWAYAGCAAGQTASAGGNPICFDFNSAISPASTSFAVRSASALACFRPDVAAIGDIGAATIVIYYCPTGDPTSTTTCGVQVGTTASVTLAGLNGIPSLQTACAPLGPGVYHVAVTAAPAGAEIGLLTVQGGQ